MLIPAVALSAVAIRPTGSRARLRRPAPQLSASRPAARSAGTARRTSAAECWQGRQPRARTAVGKRRRTPRLSDCPGSSASPGPRHSARHRPAPQRRSRRCARTAGWCSQATADTRRRNTDRIERGWRCAQQRGQAERGGDSPPRHARRHAERGPHTRPPAAVHRQATMNAMSGPGLRRLGTCAGTRCADAYADLSPAGHKRFCSLNGQNRNRVAAFRAKRRPVGGA